MLGLGADYDLLEGRVSDELSRYRKWALDQQAGVGEVRSADSARKGPVLVVAAALATGFISTEVSCSFASLGEENTRRLLCLWQISNSGGSGTGSYAYSVDDSSH